MPIAFPLLQTEMNYSPFTNATLMQWNPVKNIEKMQEPYNLIARCFLIEGGFKQYFSHIRRMGG